jgi:hypothetical protein
MIAAFQTEMAGWNAWENAVPAALAMDWRRGFYNRSMSLNSTALTSLKALHRRVVPRP